MLILFVSDNGWHFVENDCVLEEGEMDIITGPNMGGKSTYLRQTALLVILAQVSHISITLSHHMRL